MFYKKFLCIAGFVFLLFSTSSVFAVEPTTFPGPKKNITSDKRTNKSGVSGVSTATAKSSSKAKRTPGKQSVETDVPVAPTGKPKNTPEPRKK